MIEEEKKHHGALTQEQFVERAGKRHNYRYDYSESKFRGHKKVIRIKCPAHGYFHNLAGKHLYSQDEGCPRCTSDYIYREKKIKEDKIRFEIIIQAEYGDDIDVSSINYKNGRSPITVHCNVHDKSFVTTPEILRKQSNCPDCKQARLDAKKGIVVEKTRYTLPPEVFYSRMINRFRYSHGMKYGYEKTFMETVNSMIIVTCPEHGDFRIKAEAHANGEECYQCDGTQMQTANSIREALRPANRIEVK